MTDIVIFKKFLKKIYQMAVRCELVLTSARLRRADKLTPELKEINKKQFERRAERAFAAKPLGESPLSSCVGVIHNLILFSMGLFFLLKAVRPAFHCLRQRFAKFRIYCHIFCLCVR